MTITIDFINAVKAKDMRLVRIMLKDSLVIDPTFSEFNQMMNSAGKLSDLFDVHDGEKLNDNRLAWTKDYMDEQMVHIVYNFSKERLDLLKNICKHFYGGNSQKSELNRHPQQYRGTTKRQREMTKKQIGTGVAVAGAATTVIGIAVSQPIVVGVGVIAIVAGGVMIITGK